jgi:general stress protein YciG
MATVNSIHQEKTRISNRGFASMTSEKIEAIARKGGQASAAKAGHQGMAERGRLGGQVSAARAGHAGMVERGRHGGQATAKKVGHCGMAERGQRGGQISKSNRDKIKTNTVQDTVHNILSFFLTSKE